MKPSSTAWIQSESIAALVESKNLPLPTPDYLEKAFTPQHWHAAEAAVAALSNHFEGARFAEETEYGILLIPNPANLDTRQSIPPEIREAQLGHPAEDVFDARLPPGTLAIDSTAPWTMAATVIGPYGPSLGSYHDVTHAQAKKFTVNGIDTRKYMTRQFWGARVLQSGTALPDCEANEHWTFTLFPGEPTTAGLAESGTVLKGKVRFRLGKPDRGIGSARVAPAIPITDEAL